MMEKDIRKRFEIADSDKDGRLSESEFSVFVHPDRHEEMLEHLVNDQLSRFDKDSDGKVSFDEYMSKWYYDVIISVGQKKLQMKFYQWDQVAKLVKTFC